MTPPVAAYRARRPLLLCLVSLLALSALFAQDLSVNPIDLRIEQRSDGGYHLYIRAKPGVGSVLLTETTKDPLGRSDNYAYRTDVWNPVNGDERRILDGEFMPTDRNMFFLIDSTPQPDSQFGQAFQIFIPWVVDWGYSWTRNGRTFLADGTFINLRTFVLPYADYRGAFMDNPYQISVTQQPFERPAPPPAPLISPAPPAPVPPPVAPPVAPPPPVVPQSIVPPSPPPAPAVEPPVEVPKPLPDTSIYLPSTLQAFSAIAEANRGAIEYAQNPKDIVPALTRLLEAVPGDSLDLVVCLDTTDSMADDIDEIRAKLPAMLQAQAARFRHFRLGLVLYKDYFEEYVVQKHPFTTSLAAFSQVLDRIRVRGGRDIPEAVYEALYEALTGFDWLARERRVILIGDAPPHPLPRGRIDKALVDKTAATLDVGVQVIILPH